MKIVKRIEDIQGDMWCFATKEIMNFLRTWVVNLRMISLKNIRIT